MLKVAMTRPQYDEKVSELAQKGITLTGDRGEVDKEGVTVAYTYLNGTLTLQVLRKPIFVPVSVCEAKLGEWLGQGG